MNFWDIVISIGAAAKLLATIISVIRGKRRGKGRCGRCENCSYRDRCHEYNIRRRG